MESSLVFASPKECLSFRPMRHPLFVSPRNLLPGRDIDFFTSFNAIIIFRLQWLFLELSLSGFLQARVAGLPSRALPKEANYSRPT